MPSAIERGFLIERSSLALAINETARAASGTSERESAERQRASTDCAMCGIAANSWRIMTISQ